MDVWVRNITAGLAATEACTSGAAGVPEGLHGNTQAQLSPAARQDCCVAQGHPSTSLPYPSSASSPSIPHFVNLYAIWPHMHIHTKQYPPVLTSVQPESCASTSPCRTWQTCHKREPSATYPTSPRSQTHVAYAGMPEIKPPSCSTRASTNPMQLPVDPQSNKPS